MSIKCKWKAPLKRQSGRALTTGEIASYELDMRVEGAPSFTTIAGPAAADTEYTIDVNDPGLYEFRLRALGNDGSKGAYATGQITIADTSAIEAPGQFEVMLV